MNSIVYLVVTSLLVAGMVAIAIPNAIEAKQSQSHQWCVEGTAFCFDNKGDCIKFHKQGGESPTCVKTPI